MQIKQIRTKQAFILNNNIGVSYNTPIAASVDGRTFITQRYYSNTTAHHKSDIIRYFDNLETIEVNQETIQDLYYKLTYGNYTAAVEIAAAAAEEQNTKKQLLKELNGNQYTGNTIKHLKYTGVINARRNPETTPYKNGNTLTKYYYKTNFKYVSNIYYEVNIKHIPTRIPAFYGRTGYKPETITNKVKTNIVNISR